MTIVANRIVYIGFNNRVAALDRDTGRIVWDWISPTGQGYVSMLLLENHQLIVSVMGYTYSLDALTGEEQWFNKLSGFGSGVASIAASNRNNANDSVPAAAAAVDAAQTSSSNAA